MFKLLPAHLTSCSPDGAVIFSSEMFMSVLSLRGLKSPDKSSLCKFLVVVIVQLSSLRDSEHFAFLVDE